jgi:hypothetical protein
VYLFFYPVMFILLPILALIHQGRQIIIMLEIKLLEYIMRGGDDGETMTFRQLGPSIWKETKALFQSQCCHGGNTSPSCLDRIITWFRSKCRRCSECSQAPSTDTEVAPSEVSSASKESAHTKEQASAKENDLQEILEESLKDKNYQQSETSQLYDELVALSEDRFCEGFFESFPETILQLMVAFQVQEAIGMVRGISIGFSFTNLALVIMDYSGNKVKRNPVKREPNLLGSLFILVSKTPFILSRCLIISIYLATHLGKTYFLAFLGTHVFVFAMVEAICLDHGKVSKWLDTDTIRNFGKLMLRLLQRGFIATVSFLEFRTKHYEDTNKGEYSVCQGRTLWSENLPFYRKIELRMLPAK